jgi:hypothetical protein
MGRSLARVITLLVLITVMSSAQCINFCAVHPCDEAQAETTAGDAGESCHHSAASSKPEPPVRSNCTHQPVLLTGKQVISAPVAISAHELPSTLLPSAGIDVQVAIRTTEPPGSPPFQFLSRTIILRI